MKLAASNERSAAMKDSIRPLSKLGRVQVDDRPTEIIFIERWISNRLKVQEDGWEVIDYSDGNLIVTPRSMLDWLRFVGAKERRRIVR